MFRATTAFGQKAKQSITSVTPPNTSTANTASTKNQKHGFFQFFQNVLYPRTGRPWSVHELRIKSSPDLEKLWFVLMKERNALATYRHYCRQNRTPMRGWERIDKVKSSMKAILHVVAERRHAYKEVTHDKTFLRQRAIKRQAQTIEAYAKSHEQRRTVTPNQINHVTIQNKKWRRKTMGKGFELKQVYQQAQNV